MDFGGHVQHGGQQARLLDAGVPQFQGQGVRGRDGFGDAAQVVDGDAQAAFGGDGEARHAGERGRVGGIVQDFQDFVLLISSFISLNGIYSGA